MPRALLLFGYLTLALQSSSVVASSVSQERVHQGSHPVSNTPTMSTHQATAASGKREDQAGLSAHHAVGPVRTASVPRSAGADTPSFSRLVIDLKVRFDQQATSTLFTHRLAGLALLLVGGLFLLDRSVPIGSAAPLAGLGLIWLCLWALAFFWGDPEGWPIGPAGFIESFSLPTGREWVQHKILSLIALGLSIYTFASMVEGRTLSQAYTGYVIAGAFTLAGLVLWFHHHVGYHHMEHVTLQHRIMSGTALTVAVVSLANPKPAGVRKGTAWVAPIFIMILGLELAFYRE